MGISVFPAPSAAETVSTLQNTVYAASNAATYSAVLTLAPAVYSVTCVSTTKTTIIFVDSSGAVITSGSTTTGAASFNISSEVSGIRYFIDTGTNVQINIQATGAAVTYQASGTLETITSTQTLNWTGSAFAVCVQAGYNGGNGANYEWGRSYGGASGKLIGGPVAVTAGQTVATIGAVPGGHTSIGTLTTENAAANNGAAGYGEASGHPNGDRVNATASASIASLGYTIVKPSDPTATTGGGGGGGYNTPTNGAGSGIGTGGNGGPGPSSNGGNASGYGAGGGGGGTSYQGGYGTGGAGSQGVIYLVKF